jgi:hypothetical protein
MTLMGLLAEKERRTPLYGLYGGHHIVCMRGWTLAHGKLPVIRSTGILKHRWDGAIRRTKTSYYCSAGYRFDPGCEERRPGWSID